MTNWFDRLVAEFIRMGDKPRIAQNKARGTSKHARQRTVQADWREKRKQRRVMARKSRRRNR